MTQTFQEVIDRACEEPTLVKALAWVSLWECERAMKEAQLFRDGKKVRNADGSGWSTCFEWWIKEVIEEYPARKILNRLKGI